MREMVTIEITNANGTHQIEIDKDMLKFSKQTHGDNLRVVKEETKSYSRLDMMFAPVEQNEPEPIEPGTRIETCFDGHPETLTFVTHRATWSEASAALRQLLA